MSLASSVQAISFAQVALTSFSSTVDSSFGNALTGVISGGMCIMVAIFMLWKYSKYRKNTINNADYKHLYRDNEIG